MCVALVKIDCKHRDKIKFQWESKSKCEILGYVEVRGWKFSKCTSCMFEELFTITVFNIWNSSKINQETTNELIENALQSSSKYSELPKILKVQYF